MVLQNTQNKNMRNKYLLRKKSKSTKENQLSNLLWKPRDLPKASFGKNKLLKTLTSLGFGKI